MPGGHQPVANGDCTVWAVLDGQIYNHPELRERLRAEGHDFATGTDTEVLVHAYERYGEDLVHHLDGMFAFAIWDARRGRLVVARDRFGEKPLYYTDRGGQLTFASELTALCGATPGRWEARRSTRRSCGTSRPNSVSMVGSTSEDSRIVFHLPRSRPRHPSDVTGRIRSALEEAGVPRRRRRLGFVKG